LATRLRLKLRRAGATAINAGISKDYKTSAANSRNFYKLKHFIMRNFFYLTLAVFFTCSCEKDNVSNNNKKIIQPLEVGYYWTFVDSTFSYDGILSQVDTSTVSVIGKETLNYKGKEIELFYWKWDFFDRIWLSNNEDGGFYLYGLRINDNSYVVEKSLNMKYPITVGDTWDQYMFEFDQEGLYCYISDTVGNECLYTNKSFSTVVGELDCIVTKYTNLASDESWETYLYHCPDIGYVGLESKLNGVVVFSKRLIDYNLTVGKALLTTKSAPFSRHSKYLYNSNGMASE
jgi:hypothetical protein